MASSPPDPKAILLPSTRTAPPIKGDVGGATLAEIRELIGVILDIDRPGREDKVCGGGRPCLLGFRVLALSGQTGIKDDGRHSMVRR